MIIAVIKKKLKKNIKNVPPSLRTFRNIFFVISLLVAFYCMIKVHQSYVFLYATGQVSRVHHSQLTSICRELQIKT